MMTLNMKRGYRVLAVIACFVIGLAYFPVNTWAAEDNSGESSVKVQNSAEELAAELTADQTGKEVFDQIAEEPVPKGYDANDYRHPFGNGKGITVSPLKKSGLLRIAKNMGQDGDKNNFKLTADGYENAYCNDENIGTLNNYTNYRLLLLTLMEIR